MSLQSLYGILSRAVIIPLALFAIGAVVVGFGFVASVIRAEQENALVARAVVSKITCKFVDIVQTRGGRLEAVLACPGMAHKVRASVDLIRPQLAPFAQRPDVECGVNVHGDILEKSCGHP